jgi:hypothetical protein
VAPFWGTPNWTRCAATTQPGEDELRDVATQPEAGYGVGPLRPQKLTAVARCEARAPDHPARGERRRMGRAAPLLVLVFVALAAALVVLAGPQQVHAQEYPYCQPGETPHLGQGFVALASALGPLVGEPIECEHADGVMGDVLQHTSTGLFYWRKTTNTPTFSDGTLRRALKGTQVVTWIGNSLDPPSAEGALAFALAQFNHLFEALGKWTVYLLPVLSLPFLVLSARREGALTLIVVSFIVLIVGLRVYLYARPFHMTWNASWPGDQFQALPSLTIPVGLVTFVAPATPANEISKSNIYYWLLVGIFASIFLALQVEIVTVISVYYAVDTLHYKSIKESLIDSTIFIIILCMILIIIYGVHVTAYQTTNVWLILGQFMFLEMFCIMC